MLSKGGNLIALFLSSTVTLKLCELLVVASREICSASLSAGQSRASLPVIVEIGRLWWTKKCEAGCRSRASWNLI